MRVFVRSIIATFTVGAAALGLLWTATSAARAGHPVVKLDFSGVVYTADEHGNSISLIDLASGKVTTVSVPISPHNVQITADGAQLLAVGEPAIEGHGHGQADVGHHAKEAKGRLLVFDAGNVRNGPVASVRVGSHPAHVVADREGRRAFVTNAGDNAVAVVDLAVKKVERTIATGRSPHGLRVSPDGRELYVANVGDGSLSVIDTEKLIEVTRIPVGRTPVQVGFTPDGLASMSRCATRTASRSWTLRAGRRSVPSRLDAGRSSSMPLQMVVLSMSPIRAATLSRRTPSR